MKVLVCFQPKDKYSYFEGTRLRKTIKGALEIEGVEYTNNVVDNYDIVHLLSPFDENKANDAIENNIPVVVSALQCESDPDASFLEYKSSDGKRTVSLSARALRFLNKASLVLAPDEKAKSFLMQEGVVSEIQICTPGVNLTRFDFSKENEKMIFYRYFGEELNKDLVIGLGDYQTADGLNAFINAAKVCKKVLFYYFGPCPISRAKHKIKSIAKSAPKNVKFVGNVPDDVYRSALLNAKIFMFPSYRPPGIVSLFEAMAAKCQIIVREQTSMFGDLIKDGINAYVGQFSETLTSLTKDYFDGKLVPTTETAYQEVSQYNLSAIGKTLKKYYQETINLNNYRRIK